MPIDRFDEVALKARRGDVITVICYYGPKESVKGIKYPLRLDFEVLKWPASANLRGFAYSFASVWLDTVLLPLQSAEIKWFKLTLRLAGQSYQVPLVGKYGRLEATPPSDRLFTVNLIPRDCARGNKNFRIRGVADLFEQFDHPDNNDPQIVERTQVLEQSLVSSFSLFLGEKAQSPLDEAVLRYVRIPDIKKGAKREQGLKGKAMPTRFTAAFCVGFQ